MKTVKISVLLCAALMSMQTTALFAQSFSMLHAFSTNKDGEFPLGGLTMSSGVIYGTALRGDNGSGYDSGTIFSISTNGSPYSTLYSFSGSDGANPQSVPVVSGGFVYGTTLGGGVNLDGVVYRLSLTGSNSTLNALHTFDNGLGGTSPQGDLLLSGGTLYGTTAYGGSNNSGAIFSIGINGDSFTNLHAFTGGADGANPNPGQLVLSGNTLYGMASTGGSNVYGVIYCISTNGSNFTVMHSFSGPDGATPVGNLVLSGATLYGTAQLGGSNGFGAVFAIGTDGSNYRQLYAFRPLPDGQDPICTLTLSSNTLYGTTDTGGSGGSGTVFSINTDGTGYQSLYSFSAGTTTNADGLYPRGTLLISGTNLYGIASQGGPNGLGTIFELGVVPTTITDTAPVITVQPTNESVPLGSNATLTVTASGVPAPTYQWQFNGTNINLATDSSYTVTNAQLSDQGDYSVIVSNALNTVTSSNAFVTVSPAPFFDAGISLGGDWYWLEQTTNSVFGFYNYSPTNFPFLFHLDLGEEYFFDAGNAQHGGYFYDFTDGAFFYTEPHLFPFLYDFKAEAWMWYYPADPSIGVGRYTSNPRVFYNFTTKNKVNHL